MPCKVPHGLPILMSTQQAHIAGHIVQIRFSERTVENPAFQMPMRGEDPATKICQSIFAREDNVIACMKRQEQFFPQKIGDRCSMAFHLLLGAAEEDKIIAVPQVTFHPQSVFDEPIQFVQVNIGEYLAGNVPDGNSAPATLSLSLSSFLE